MAVAYPDSHVKGIKVRYRDKETTAIGLAMPREAALVNIADEILVAGRFFDEGDQPEAILGVQLASEPGVQHAARGHRGRGHRRGRYPGLRRRQQLFRRPQAADRENRRRLPGPAADARRLAEQGLILPVELMKEIHGHGPRVGLDRESGGTPTAADYPSVTVRVRDPADLDGVEKEIRGMGYHTRTVLSRLQDMRRFFLAIQLLLTAVGSIALAIAALGIVNTLLMAVLERYQEIGLCKAIGASDGDLFVLFLTEAGIIGFLGGLTGIALGWLMSWGMEAAASVYAHQHGITGRLDLFAFPLWLLAVSLAFAVVVSVVAGIYPALRAARVDPIRALRSH